MRAAAFLFDPFKSTAISLITGMMMLWAMDTRKEARQSSIRFLLFFFTGQYTEASEASPSDLWTPCAMILLSTASSFTSPSVSAVDSPSPMESAYCDSDRFDTLRP